MFEQLFSSMSKAGTPDFFGPMQRMMDCTMRLTQSQIKVMTGLYEEVGREFSNSMKASSDPSAVARRWPQLMATATRANAEAGALLMKNAQEFQSELLKMVPSSHPSLSREFMRNIMDMAKNATVANGAIANGGAAMQAARESRAKKAA
jgi:hypothetical protein